MNNPKAFTVLDPALIGPAVIAAFNKLNPKVQWRNPVMFVVFIGSILTTGLGLLALQSPHDAMAKSGGSAAFIFAIAVWLWFTVPLALYFDPPRGLQQS